MMGGREIMSYGSYLGETWLGYKMRYINESVMGFKIYYGGRMDRIFLLIGLEREKKSEF